MPILANPTGDFDGPRQVPFGIDLSYVGLAVAKYDLSSLKPESLSDLRGRRVP
jgi:hypothetical protein